MKKIFTVIAFAALLFTCSSCTEHTRARTWGGTESITLDPGQKLVEVTWKENNIWYLTEPMEEGYVPKTKIFQEDSRFGVMEGKVIFTECR